MKTPSSPSQLRLDSARGALLGLAVGDAFGTTREFENVSAPDFPAHLTGPHTTITGQGPFNLAPGQVTDDTQLAVCLSRSLLERGGIFDADDVAQRYLAWSKHAFDIGNQTYGALYNVGQGMAPSDAGRTLWMERGRRSAGNGSLMRSAPIAVAFARDPDAVIRISLADSAITHYDPRCMLACAAHNAAIAAAIRAPLSGHQMLVVAREALPEAAALMSAADPEHAEHIQAAEAALLDDLRLALCDDPRLKGSMAISSGAQGFVRIAFRVAFYAATHHERFDAALIDIVNRGGDADTNGAIAGALLGARDGASGIPAGWGETVLNALQDGPPSPWRDAYHPRAMMALPEATLTAQSAA